MENKQEIEKEYEKMKMEHEAEINSIIKQESSANIELEKVSIMNNKDIKVIRDLKKNFMDNDTNSGVSVMVNELYSIAILGDIEYIPHRKNKNKKDAELVGEIVEKLKVKILNKFL